jgi:hypothetical protein
MFVFAARIPKEETRLDASVGAESCPEREERHAAAHSSIRQAGAAPREIAIE